MVSLRITSQALTTLDITERLGVEPSETARRGERMSSRNPRSRVRDKNTWLLRREADDSSVEVELDAVVRELAPKSGVLRELAAVCECDLTVACEVPSQLGLVMTADQINFLASAGLRLVFSLYSACDGSVPHAGHREDLQGEHASPNTTPRL